MTFAVPHQEPCYQTWADKHALRDNDGSLVDKDIPASFRRVAKTLAKVEPKNQKVWEARFYDAMLSGAIPGGRILSNAGSGELKNAVSLINCVVSGTINDSIQSIMEKQLEAVMTLRAGCGIGYEFSTLRYKGAHVKGAGAFTSGPLSFMDGYDKYCDTISSAGGRRGAQMATFDVSHPDVEDFIKAKREDKRLRKFNLSLLITDEFVQAVKDDAVWEYKWLGKPVGKSIRAQDLWDLIMRSTYEYAEPGILMIDVINRMNNLWFCENIRATNPCGEQPLPPYGACLLGSMNLVMFVRNPFSENAYFDFKEFDKVVRVFNRMLDNVVEISGLPLEQQREELKMKRRHGLGFMGLGSAMAMLGIRYGSEESVKFTDEVTYKMALASYDEGASLAKEKGMAPILKMRHEVDGKLHRGVDLFLRSGYMQQFQEREDGRAMLARIKKHGCRFTHAISIAPTGTTAYGLGNNVSGGIEPSYQHAFLRNRIIEGKATKEQVDVFSYEMLVFRAIKGPDAEIPKHMVTALEVPPKEHIDVQAAAQKWVDSSISKTVNVPAECSFEDFKHVYAYAIKKGLKGCTTYRPNPEKIGEVLVSKEAQAKRIYEFQLEDGSIVTARGNEKIKYCGEEHVAALLYEAIREGNFGKF